MVQRGSKGSRYFDFFAGAFLVDFFAGAAALPVPFAAFLPVAILELLMPGLPSEPTTSSGKPKMEKAALEKIESTERLFRQGNLSHLRNSVATFLSLRVKLIVLTLAHSAHLFAFQSDRVGELAVSALCLRNSPERIANNHPATNKESITMIKRGFQRLTCPAS